MPYSIRRLHGKTLNGISTHSWLCEPAPSIRNFLNFIETNAFAYTFNFKIEIESNRPQHFSLLDHQISLFSFSGSMPVKLCYSCYSCYKHYMSKISEISYSLVCFFFCIVQEYYYGIINNISSCCSFSLVSCSPFTMAACSQRDVGMCFPSKPSVKLFHTN